MIISFKDAKTRVLNNTTILRGRDLALFDTIGLVLAEDVVAPIDLPPFDNSAMDGVVIKIPNSKSQIPKLKISQTIKAGDWPAPLQDGTCAKIMTGASIPVGADTVAPVEDVIFDSDVVIFNKGFKSGQYIRHKGEDVKRGEIVARKGDRITTGCIGLFAALGLTHLPVYPRPRVAIIATGNELQQIGMPLKDGKIYDCNKPMLVAALKEVGIDAKTMEIGDDKQIAIKTICHALETNNVVITIGGVSVGEYDYVKDACKESGVAECFHKVAIKPGKPVFFGIGRERQLVFGLPGNPFSCFVTFEEFVKPALFKMMGVKDFERRLTVAIAEEPLSGILGLRVFIRGVYKKLGDRVLACPTGLEGSHKLKPFTSSNCLIIIPEDRKEINVGEKVDILI